MADVTRDEIKDWEDALADLGGVRQAGEPRLPGQLLVFRPENAGSWDWFDALDWSYEESPASCLRRTVRSDRGIVYVSGEDGAAIGVFDYQGAAFQLPDWGSVAPGVLRPFRRSVSRRTMGEHPDLEMLFRGRAPQRGQGLNPRQAQAIISLAGRGALPPALLMPEGERAEGELEWRRAAQVWGRELPMRDAVLARPRQWRKLFANRPEPEKVSNDRLDRYDLISEPDRTVAEFKLAATTATLSQLDRYLTYLSQESGEAWVGHIVYGNSCTRSLRREVANRGDVTLWRCDRDPRLVRE